MRISIPNNSLSAAAETLSGESQICWLRRIGEFYSIGTGNQTWRDLGGGQSILAGATVGSVIGLGPGAHNSLDKGDEEF